MKSAVAEPRINRVDLTEDPKPCLPNFPALTDEPSIISPRCLHSETAEAAHDFRNILNVVSMLTDFALIELPITSPTVSVLRNIKTACSDANGLCNRMMDAYRNVPVSAERVNLSKLIDDMKPLFATYLPHHCELRFDLGDQRSLVLISAGAVGQIIMNLVKNAAEALGRKPGTILVSTGFVDFEALRADECSFQNLRKTGRYSFFSVADTGCGMDTTMRDHLFDRSFTSKNDGHGLGLASVQRITLHYGGILHVQSKVGSGTRIHVLFPCV